MDHLFHSKNLRKFFLLAGVEGTGNYIGNTKDVFVKTTQRLGYHPTLVIARSKVLFDVVDVSNNVILFDLYGRLVIVEGKHKTNLTAVIPDGPW